MNHFDLFKSNHDVVVANAASMLDQTTHSYQNKSISKNEYIELCNDILDYERISANISDMIRLQDIQNAFQQLGAIVSAIASI